jgi:CRISPR-associated protein Csb2
MPRLLVSVQFYEGRYHGSGEWPPSPARLFQALVAGAARGGSLSARMVEALEWLEGLDAPVIAAPPAYDGSGFRTYVPNNDLDAVGGDPARIGEIRTPKIIRPRHFDARVPLVYAWTYAENAATQRHAETVCEIACSLYQLGRGVDMAWARSELLGDADGSERLGEVGSVLWRPNDGGHGVTLACPHPRSFATLTERFNKARERFRTVGEGRKVSQQFLQAPKPSFSPIVYESPGTHLLFDIRQGDRFAPQPLDGVVTLTETIRNGAVARMAKGLPERADLVQRVLVGRGATEADKARRVRITPLPSIGHAQVVRSLRRVLVTVPPDCPISKDDIEWAFSGLPLDFDPETGELPADSALLVPSLDRAMLANYCVETRARHRRWRTVTPAALPERAARRRIDPRRKREEAKGGVERLREQASAEAAVRQALRHAGLGAELQAIRVQREPFESKGKRAELFAGARFAKERLWHVEIVLATTVRGPILIGDGRYLGLGLMAPIEHLDGIWSFAILDGLAMQAEPLELTHALRRSVMARVQHALGDRATLPTFFSGHESDGDKAHSGSHKHLAFVFDGLRSRLLVVAPHILEGRQVSALEREYLQTLARALEDFRELRAGRAGRLLLAGGDPAMPDDPLFARSTTWRSLTPYLVTRHARVQNAAAAVKADLLAECQRNSLPRPHIEVDHTFAKPSIGLFGVARLEFRAAIGGPILLGRDRHFGGGLFVPSNKVGDNNR